MYIAHHDIYIILLCDGELLIQQGLQSFMGSYTYMTTNKTLLIGKLGRETTGFCLQDVVALKRALF